MWQRRLDLILQSRLSVRIEPLSSHIKPLIRFLSDVSTQSNSPGWTLEKWSEYYSQAPGARDKIRNVISLEFSNTPLAEQVAPPRIVKDLDWVDKFWPTAKKGPGQAWPKVQMYCLMGVAHAWTVSLFL